MAQELRQSLQPDSTCKFPMEEKLKKLRTDPRVTMFLLPFPKTAAKETDKATGSGDRPPPPNRRPKKPRVSAKAKSMCRKELKEFDQKDGKGNAIRWAFNLKGGCKGDSLVACRSN